MRLVLRCDDFGYTPVWNMAVKEILKQDMCTYANVMPTTPGAVDALETLRQYPWVAVGWHVHWWGKPSADPARVPSLLDENGNFKFRRDMWDHPEHSAMLDADPDEVYIEFTAQMDKYLRYLGRVPDFGGFMGYVDVTNGTRFTGGVVGDVATRICKEYGIRNERPKEQGNHTLAMPAKSERPQTSSYAAPRYSEDSRVRNCTYDPLGYLLRDEGGLLQKETAGFTLHPGYLDSYVYDDFMFWYRYDRAYFDGAPLQDALCLTSPKLRKWLIENKVELVSQLDIVNGTNAFQNHLRHVGSDLWIGNM